MNNDERNEQWRTEARSKLKHMLEVRLYDYKHSLQHCDNSEGMTGAGQCLGSIHAMRDRGLLTAEEVSAYQAQLRADFAERLPQYLEYFDELMLIGAARDA